jgi:hypothetical protein
MLRIRLLIAVPFICYFLAACGWPSQNLSAYTTHVLDQIQVNMGMNDSAADQVSSEEALVTLTSIQVHGAAILSDAELQACVEQFVGVPLRYEQMFEVVMTLESYYRKHNYLARVMLPTQDLSQGVLQLEVMESVVTLAEVDKKLEEIPDTRPQVEALLEVHKLATHTKVQQEPGESDVELLLSMYQSRSSTDDVTDSSNDLMSFLETYRPPEKSIARHDIENMQIASTDDISTNLTSNSRSVSPMWHEAWPRRRRQMPAPFSQTSVN